MQTQGNIQALLIEYQECMRFSERNSNEAWRTANILVIGSLTGAAFAWRLENNFVVIWGAIVAIGVLVPCFLYLRRVAGLTLAAHRRVHQIQVRLGMRSSLYVYALDAA